MTAATEKKNDFQIGDILYSSWGYDQTNVAFYRVIRVTAASVTMEPIGMDVVENGVMCGEATPNGIATSEKVLTKRVTKYGSVKIDSFEIARKWDGKPLFCSWYA